MILLLLGRLGVPEARRSAVREAKTRVCLRRTTEKAINEIRQQARKSAAERVARLRQQRAELVKNREGLSADVMFALAERDALMADAEPRAGTALKARVSSGPSLAETTLWCNQGDKDAARLLRLAARTTTRSGESAASDAARAF